MAAPSTAIARHDLGITIEEFNLVANQAGFIGPSVLKPIVVGAQSGNIPKVKDQELSTVPETARAPGGAYKRDDFEFDSLGYMCSEHGREVPLDDATLKIYASVIDAEVIAVKRMTHQMLSRYEWDVAAAVYDTAVWNGAPLTTALGTPWSTHADSTPIDDIQAAKETRVIAAGIECNALVCNRRQLWHLLQSEQLLSRMSSNVQKDNMTVKQALLELLDIDQIIVAGGLKNTANQAATPSYGRIWSLEYAMVCRVAVTDDPSEVCIGRTILWNEDGPSSAGTDQALALITEEYREEGVRGSVIRSRNYRGLKIMFPKCGHLLSNVADN